MEEASKNYMTPAMDFITPNLTSDTLYRMLLCAHIQSGSFQLNDFWEIRIEDIGPWSAQTNSQNGVRFGSGTSGSGGSVQTYTKSYYATATHSYYGVTGTRGSGSNGKRSDNSTCYQGCPSGGAFTYGDQHSYAVFDHSTIASDLSGATINWMKIRLTNVVSGYSSGTYAILGYTTYSSTFGDPFIPGAGTHFFQTYSGWQKGQTRTYDISGTTIPAAFQSGGATAITFGRSADRTTGTDLTNYGGYFGYSASNHANCPMLQISYSK